MSEKKNTLVFIYNSFNDPLFQNLVLSYLKTLSKKNSGSFHIITFEQPQYYLDPESRKAVRKNLLNYRMYWYPMTFHTGRFLLLKKAWDFGRAFFRVVFIRFRFQTHWIFAFANISAAFSIVFARLLRMKMIVYSYEPHSEFLADLGFWDRSGLKFRLLNYLERIAGRHADYVMTGTKYMVERLKSDGSKGRLYRAPTAVDENEFYFRETGRRQIRQRLQLETRCIFLYIGKFGDLYYEDEIPKMMSAICREIPEAYLLIVTSNDHGMVNDMCERYLPEDSFYVTGHLTFDEVKNYISAADFGISGVPPSPSQRYRSPTKVAEYLLCGLPYITTGGVSEDDVWAEKENVGVVLEHFSGEISNDQFNKIRALLKEDRQLLRDRCRSTGLAYRSKEHIDKILEEIYSQ